MERYFKGKAPRGAEDYNSNTSSESSDSESENDSRGQDIRVAGGTAPSGSNLPSSLVQGSTENRRLGGEKRKNPGAGRTAQIGRRRAPAEGSTECKRKNAEEAVLRENSGEEAEQSTQAEPEESSSSDSSESSDSDSSSPDQVRLRVTFRKRGARAVGKRNSEEMGEARGEGETSQGGAEEKKKHQQQKETEDEKVVPAIIPSTISKKTAAKVSPEGTEISPHIGTGGSPVSRLRLQEEESIVQALEDSDATVPEVERLRQWEQRELARLRRERARLIAREMHC